MVKHGSFGSCSSFFTYFKAGGLQNCHSHVFGLLSSCLALPERVHHMPGSVVGLGHLPCGSCLWLRGWCYLPILQRRKLRSREVHVAHKFWRQDNLNPCLEDQLTSKIILSMKLCSLFCSSRNIWSSRILRGADMMLS